ncbi:MAG TPA: polyphenol oxidase family protein [Acidobacteriota bacterium]
MIDLAEKEFAGQRLTLHESENLVFGFSGADFPAADLKRLFPDQPLLFLKQVHSDRIVAAAEWRAGLEADGLFLDRPGAVAVIQTADCLPLFFFDDARRRGGVIHVGWRGLQSGIEEKLAARLGADLGSYSFFLGPAIEKKCYEVGEELPRLFANKKYGREIFSIKGGGKYLMDLKAGLKLSLAALGVAAERIQDSGLCTFCSRGRFPSYRRDGRTGKRIFNFLLLKNGHPGGK